MPLHSDTPETRDFNHDQQRLYDLVKTFIMIRREDVLDVSFDEVSRYAKLFHFAEVAVSDDGIAVMTPDEFADVVHHLQMFNAGVEAD